MSVINQLDIEDINETVAEVCQSGRREWFCGHSDRLHG